MRNFILIDHSITSRGGHHYEYAAHVLKAAAAAGYVPVLATNRRFCADGSAPWTVYRLYELGYWGHLSFPVLSGWFGRFMMPQSLPVHVAGTRPSGGLPRMARRAGAKLMRSGYDRMRRWSFASGTRRLFRSLRLGSQDIVFVPTLSHVELQGLLDHFRRRPHSGEAAWHLLFRRDLPLAGPWANGPLESIRSAFLRARNECGSPRVYFYTDTDELTDQYNRLGIVRFRTLPIPHTRPPTGRRRAAGQPLCILYVGDARAEKGYHHLPWLIQELWAGYVETGRVRFVLHSHFPVAGGEPTVSEARRELERYPRDKVRLVTGPLSSEEYWATLEEGDIILLLYDRDTYAARSSGVLAEALAAGTPVIVPAGTWMARQVESAERMGPTANGPRGPIGLTYHDIREVPGLLLRRLIEHHSDYLGNAVAFAHLWHERHNATRLVAVLEEISGDNRTS